MACKYKQTNVQTKSVGGAGAQVRIGEVTKLDAQGVNGYLHNIRISALLNAVAIVGDQNFGGYIAYLTTDNVWSDEYIITARAGNFADTVNLTAKRKLTQSTDQASGNTGAVHLWIECTDIGSASKELRIVTETWGNFIKFDEV